MAEIPGACPLDCPDACTWTVTVEDGKAVKLRPRRDHPFTQGSLCVKVNSYLDHTAHPDRLLHPMRRVGPKGSGDLEQITWDEALEEIADRLRAAIERHGAETIWPYAGTGTVGFVQGVIGAGKRLFHHLGASRHAATICSVSGHVGMKYTMGSACGMDPEDLRHSNLILLWGTNTLTSNQHLRPFIAEARERGAQVWCIDPVRTRTAEWADHHVALRPGTDAALALGLMKAIVGANRHDEEFLATRTVGWDEFRASLEPWTLTHTADVCGLDEAVIAGMADEMGTTRPMGVRMLMGMQRHAGGGQAARVLSCLPAVTGDHGVLGGGINYSTASAYGLDHHALNRPDLQPHRARSLAMTRLGHGLLDLDDPPVTALIVWAANPMVSNPDTSRVRQGLERADLFTVVIEHFITDTARYADIVLPSTMQTEHADLHDSFSHLYLNWNEPAVEAPGECLSHTEIFRRLARAMGVTEPAVMASDLEIAADALGDHPSVAGIDFGELRERGWARLTVPAPYLPMADSFPTSSGKFEFVSPRADEDGVGRLPHFVAPLEATRDEPETVALIAPANHHFLNSVFANRDFHQTKAGQSRVAVNPDDADRFGLVDGEMTRVSNHRGYFDAVVEVSEAVRVGTAATTKGRWLDADGRGVNSVSDERDSDMGRGAVYHDMRVTLSPQPI